MNSTEQRLVTAVGLAAATGIGLVIGRLSWRAIGSKVEPPLLPALPLPLHAGATAEEARGPTLDLASLTELDATPEQFYMPDSSLAALTDSFAVVEGSTRFPLHSQVGRCGCALTMQLSGSSTGRGAVV